MKGKKRQLKPIKAKKLKLRRPPITQDGEPEEVDFSKMQQRSKLRLEKFCHEYIKDFNATASVMRMGYNFKDRTVAQVFGSKMFDSPYVAFYLRKLMEETKDEAIVTKNEVMFSLKREANDYINSGGERIAALRTMAKIMGLEILKVEGKFDVEGGVMALPFTGSLEQWEEACRNAQAKLKETVKA